MKLKPVVAGTFYPGNKRELEKDFVSFEKTYEPVPLEGKAAGFLLPHAGYPYSGAVAALGYRSLASQEVRTVVVAGPSHYLPFRGASIFAGASVVTPLGELPVDQEACECLLENDTHLGEIPQAFAKEHSVEVHFPLIQKYLPDASVVPLVLGQGMKEAVEPLVEALRLLGRKKDFLLIASSDLSHYPIYKKAVEADRRFLDAVLTGRSEAVDQADEEIMGRGYSEYYCTHCGKEPLAVLMGWAQATGADKPQLLAYRNSGDVTGDHVRVVGYAAVAFFR
jgi:AmmeMemoRadiSam system protein B